MRPPVLFPLYADASGLKGVGEKALEALRRLFGKSQREPVRLLDVVLHLPSSLIDRRHICCIADIQAGQVCTLKLRVLQHVPSPPRSRKPYKVLAGDDSGTLELVFFNARADYLEKLLPTGQERIISGTAERFDGLWHMPHPDHVVPASQMSRIATLEPVYPLTYALTQKQLRFFISQALDKLPTLPEWIEPELRKQQEWPAFDETLKRLHGPQAPDDIALESCYRRRLAYDELLANQLALFMFRAQATKEQGICVSSQSALQQQLKERLPFALTQGQEHVLAEIMADIASGQRMLRLLQGDVGSGKTVVAVLAMLPLIEAGYQAALMVPTEILGRQHLASISRMLEPLGIRCAMVSGKLPVAQRRQLEEEIAQGLVQVVVGTHALFQESLKFHRLGMVIIDEQHRFGVEQRLALGQKGQQPHMLLMTATPIPRSLTMTAYGDMDCSSLHEKPANRLPIRTSAVPLARIDDVVAAIRRAIAAGSRIYWICPLIEEAEPSVAKEFEGDLAAATERYEVLSQLFGPRVALAHGRQKPAERAAAMDGFACGEYAILVATTVVEVGVDVPEATVIVIEHAERFGLAQLHQLRGRVGRSDKPSDCILLYAPKCSEIARKRLSVIRQSNDGFFIAEEDLMLRGAGDVLGTRQSGLPDFRFANLQLHRDLIPIARDDVKLLMHHDAALQSARGQALRLLLNVFGHDESLRLLPAG